VPARGKGMKQLGYSIVMRSDSSPFVRLILSLGPCKSPSARGKPPRLFDISVADCPGEVQSSNRNREQHALGTPQLATKTTRLARCFRSGEWERLMEIGALVQTRQK